MRATHRLLSRAAATACADGLQLHGLAPSAGSWRESRVAADKTHHVSAAERVPLYAARFTQVLPFHAPGLAPAQLLDGRWSHIRPSGEPLVGRFLRTFGFYGGERAAVTLSPGVWRHVDANGVPAYDRTWTWCGNFQAGRCVVRDNDGPGGSPRYRHILADGTLLSRESYVYAGDFREGYAVVRTGETCDHIDEDGARMHRSGDLLDLDVSHKGFARARDAAGWFFIGMDSGADAMKPAGTRYAQLEPFYNGHAVAMRSDGARVLLADDTLAETLLAV